jgi:phosphohistidine phosphatase
MKTLSLLRHAKSSWNDISLSDFDRPLNKRGEHDAPLMGRFLHTKGVRPEQIVSSPALRAITTAGIIASALGNKEEAIRQLPSIYEANVNELMNLLRGLDNQAEHIMLVGHNPGLSMLASILTDKSYDLPTCAYLSLKLDIDAWSDLTPGVGRELVYYRPGDINP